MPIQRPPLVKNEIYHIVIRGVGDSLIFKNENDHYRGIFSLFEFNTTCAIEIRWQREKRRAQKKLGEQFSDTRDLLVEILAFSFMPNHIHLLLRQVKDKGITQFMRKFGAGYAAYFNKKYDRRGHLFQGRFRAVHIQDDKQLKMVFIYIHTNPISLTEPGWKEDGIKNPGKVIEFLENYKWSSYPDYLGKKNFPSVTKREFLLETIDGGGRCKELIKMWVQHKEKRADFGVVALE